MLLMSPLSSGLNIRHRSRAIAVAIVQIRLPLANHGEGEIPTGTTIEGLVDPEHPKGFEQSRDPSRLRKKSRFQKNGHEMGSMLELRSR